jgi:hypothetical protein
MIKRFRLAMAIVIAAPLAMTAAGKSVAAPVLPGASPLKASCMYQTLVQLARNYSEPVAFVDDSTANEASKTSIGRF